MTEIIAHRGNSHIAPQNTLVAFEAAWRAGADAFEIDIQPLADGTAAVIHDATVDATTDGSGPVADYQVHELALLDAGIGFAPAYEGERVPLFTQVIEFLQLRADINLLLEVKGDWDRTSLETVLTQITAAQLQDRVIVQSFSFETMAHARDLAPQVPREVIVKEIPETLDGPIADLQVQGVNPDGAKLLEHPDFVDQIHAAGLRVSTWTLNEPHQWQQAVAAGVDGIITDRPDRLAGWLGR